jgi:NAD(P)-dependent dehydrogenase (short-subunit alcohol dehydrogenase family)
MWFDNKETIWSAVEDVRNASAMQQRVL